MSKFNDPILRNLKLTDDVERVQAEVHDLRAQADLLASQALFGDLFASDDNQALIAELTERADMYQEFIDAEPVAEPVEAPELVNPLCDVSVIIRANGEERVDRPRYAQDVSDLIAAWVLVCEKYHGARLFLRGLSDGEEVEVTLTDSLDPQVINYEEREMLKPLFAALSLTRAEIHEIAAQQITITEERLAHFTCRSNPPMRRHYEGVLAEWRAILEPASAQLDTILNQLFS